MYNISHSRALALLGLSILLMVLIPLPVGVAPVRADHTPDPVIVEEPPPTCVTIQRGAFGDVQDAYIWARKPDRNGKGAMLYTGEKRGAEQRSLIKFDLGFLPSGAVFHSATFGIYRKGEQGSGQTVNIHPVTQAWGEKEPTWSSFNNKYDPAVGSFDPFGGWATADVLGLVSAWVDGTAPNYGLMLISPGPLHDAYRSSEFGKILMRPWLEVCYVVPPPP